MRIIMKVLTSYVDRVLTDVVCEAYTRFWNPKHSTLTNQHIDLVFKVLIYFAEKAAYTDMIYKARADDIMHDH